MRKGIENFVLNYDHDRDFNKINFDWNGKHGNQLIDNNDNFRADVVLYIVDNYDNVSEQIDVGLLKDLYVEMAKSSKETWGVSRYYGNIAEFMLKKGRTKYVMDYLDGTCYGMDSYCGSAIINIDEELKKELYNYCMTEFKKTNLDKDHLFYKVVKLRFGTEDLSKLK